MCADIVSSDVRSQMMARIRGKDTAPELAIRRQLHAFGYRFRVHRRDLPGRPDIVLPRFRATVFVHGCFWHRHPNCVRASRPKTNQSFWDEKFESNMARDKRKATTLRQLGWTVATLWECETEDDRRLEGRLRRIFGMPSLKGTARTAARTRIDAP